MEEQPKKNPYRRAAKPAVPTERRPGLRKLPKDLDDLATGRTDRLPRRRPEPSRLIDDREGAVIPGVRNAEARTVYDAHVASLRAAVAAGNETTLRTEIEQARRMRLWRARNVTDYRAFAESVVGASPELVESLVAESTEVPADEWPADAVALAIRVEAALLARTPGARVRLEGDGASLRMSLDLAANEAALAVEALLDAGRAANGLWRFLRDTDVGARGPERREPRDERVEPQRREHSETRALPAGNVWNEADGGGAWGEAGSQPSAADDAATDVHYAGDLRASEDDSGADDDGSLSAADEADADDEEHPLADDDGADDEEHPLANDDGAEATFDDALDDDDDAATSDDDALDDDDAAASDDGALDDDDALAAAPSPARDDVDRDETELAPESSPEARRDAGDAPFRGKRRDGEQTFGGPRHDAADAPFRGKGRDGDATFRGPRRDGDNSFRGPRRDADNSFRGPRRDGDNSFRGPRRDTDNSFRGPRRDGDAPFRGPRRDSDSSFRGPRRDGDAPFRGPRRDDDASKRGDDRFGGQQRGNFAGPRRDGDSSFRGKRGDDRFGGKQRGNFAAPRRDDDSSFRGKQRFGGPRRDDTPARGDDPRSGPKRFGAKRSDDRSGGPRRDQDAGFRGKQRFSGPRNDKKRGPKFKR